MRSVPWHALIGGLLLSVMITAPPSDAQAEWYAAGYGGLSGSSSLTDVTMPQLGQRLAEQQFPQANAPLDSQGRGTLIQTFKTSDVSLKSSAIFGGKVGYFFTEEKFPWLGIELEAFTANPKIKSQTLDTVHDVTYQPNTPASAAQCAPPVPQPNCPGFALNKSTLSLEESSLRVTTVAFNLIARYPGSVFQPYAGVGAAALYFTSSSGSIQGHQVSPGFNALTGVKVFVTEGWGLFLEGKYVLSSVSNFDPTFGLSGVYSAFNILGGIAYHF